MNVRENAREIRVEQERLDKLFPKGFLYMTTLDHREKNMTGGVTSEVTTVVAAKHLAEGTGRLANESEIEALRRKHAATKQVIVRGQMALAPRPLAVTVTER
jgi:hypothetical protein